MLLGGLECLWVLFSLWAGFDVAFILFIPPLVWDPLPHEVQGSSGHALLTATYGAESHPEIGWKLIVGRSGETKKEAVFRPLFWARSL